MHTAEMLRRELYQFHMDSSIWTDVPSSAKR